MSVIPKETIEVIAQSIGINNLSPDVAPALAPDVEYRIREIMQEAIKCMRHSKRTILTVEDVDSALHLRNVEPIYGFASGDPLRFKRAVGHKDLYYIEDKDLDFKDVIEAPLPKAPLDTTVMVHWLAIEGVQPAIPENAPVDVQLSTESRKSEHSKDDGLPVDIKLPVKHVLSRELQIYFDKITELIVGRSDSTHFKQALSSLAADSGLHPLVPYFTYFIQDEVARSLNDFPLLFALMRVVRSLLQNPHIHIEPYLHQLMPAIITCLVATRVGSRFSDNHWELRDFSATLVASICKRYGHAYHNIQPRVTKTLLNAFLDTTKALTQHYGAIQGLSALGPTVVQQVILPALPVYLKLLEPEMLFEKQKNEMKRHEAYRVYGALLHAAGSCLYERIKSCLGLLNPPRIAWKTNKRVAPTAVPQKRTATTEYATDQPAVKRVASENMFMNIPMESSPSAQKEGIAHPSTGQGEAFGSTLASQLLPNGGRSVVGLQSNSEFPQNISRKIPSSAVVHAQSLMKEDVEAGRLLMSLYDLFGEAILSFVPSGEKMIFI